MLKEKMRWIFFADMLEDEYTECLQEGRAVEAFRGEIDAVHGMDGGRRREEAARQLLLAMEQAPVRPDFPYTEPDTYQEIAALLPQAAAEEYAVDAAALPEHIRGAWQGRISGCVLGIPVEGWPREKIAAYLKESGQLPLQDYMQAVSDRQLREKYGICREDITTPYDRQEVCWRNYLDEYPNDDDINYSVIALKTMERYGLSFTPCDMAEAWLLGIPAFHACTAERAAIRNLMNGLLPPDSAIACNPYREWIGAQIRGDLFGYVCPGMPKKAARLAWNDAAVSHTKNGIYGEMFIAALLSLCYVKTLSMADRIRLALLQIPEESRLHQAIHSVLARYLQGDSFDAVVNDVHAVYDEKRQFDWCLTIPNAMLVTACILWHDSYDAAVAAAVQSGFDTDCNGATVGSVFGLAGGIGSIAPKWWAGFAPVVNSSVHGYHRMSLDELCRRTEALACKELSLS